MPRDATYYFTKAESHRAIPENKLQAIARSHGIDGQTYPTVGKAYAAAMENASVDDLVFIGGSSYVVGDFLRTCQTTA